jgi:hypothetical protein
MKPSVDEMYHTVISIFGAALDPIMDLDPAFTSIRNRIQGVKSDAYPDPGEALALSKNVEFLQKIFFLVNRYR